jgi:hemolysin activation/secretion protein
MREYDFRIEEPRKSPVPRAVDVLTFEVRDIRVVGATAFPPESFRPLIEPVVGKTVRLSDIVGVADQIEAKYHAAGYVLTRAFVPPQSVSDGIFQIDVVEGYVKAVSVEAKDESVRSRIETMLQPIREQRPLEISTMERALLLANELPGVTASGLLRPSPTAPGASDLVVTVTESPYSGIVALDNRGSKFTNMWTLTGYALVNSPVNDGGQAELSVSGSPDFVQRRAYQARYRHPIGDEGLSVSMGGLVSIGAPGASLGPVHITTNTFTIGPRASYPLMVSRSSRLSLDGGFTWQSADVHALGLPFSHDEWRPLDAALTYQQTGFWGGVTGATLGIVKGLPIFDATEPGSPKLSRPGARTDYTKTTMSISRVQTIDESWSAALSANGQYSFQTLVNGEEITFGGSLIGRGYDPGAIAGDNGIGGSVELRYDFKNTGLPIDGTQFYAFYETAKVWNHANSFTSQLASTGTGVRVFIAKDVNFSVEYARSLDSVPSNDNGRKGARILFVGTVRF